MSQRRLREGSARREFDRAVPFILTDILANELGYTSARSMKDGRSLRDWRRCLLAFITATDRAIRDTVVGDPRHKQRLRHLCTCADISLRKARTHADLLAATAAHLPLICFHLLGGARLQKSGSHRSWSLARHRTLCYTTSDRQMRDRIHDALLHERESLPAGAPSMAEVRSLRSWPSATRVVDDASFVEEIRVKYPETYAAIFCGGNEWSLPTS